MAIIDKISVKNTSYDIGADSDNIVYDSNNSVKDKIDEYEAIIPSSASSSNKLATATDIPTETSDLTNDSNFISDANYVHTDNNYDATAKGIVDGVTSALALKANITDLNNYIEKSTTEGLIKNDGTIDESTFVRLKFELTGNLSTKIQNGYTSFNGNRIQTDRENIYYSDSASGVQQVLDKSTSTQNTKTQNGYNNIYGEYIQTDGDNIYYSYGNSQQVLDKSTSTQNTKTQNGYNNIYGNRIQTDRENIYYSNSSRIAQYVLDKSTNTWNEKTQNGFSDFDGDQIQTDGDNIYYSYGSNQYILDKSTSTQNTKTQNGFSRFDGEYIQTDGDNIYYSDQSDQYILDKSTSTWNTKTWTGFSDFDGNRIWTDRENIYYSSSSDQYVFDKTDENTDGFVKPDGTIDTNTYALASAIPGVATASTVGTVKPDGTTITVDANGTLSTSGSGDNVLSKTRYQIIATNWSNSVDANGYYTYTITLNPTLSTTYSPNIWIAGATDNTLATDTEKAQYDLLNEQCNLTSESTLVLYAKTKPTSNFYIWVESKASGSGGGSGSSGVAESVVGTVENSTIASKAYAVGEHFIRNDKFCTAIAAIASGVTLTLNTNYVEGTIADNINYHVYSATERVVGKWVDGKDIFEKTFDFGPINTNSSYDVLISNLGTVIKVYGLSGEGTPVPYLDTAGAAGFVGWYKFAGGVCITTGRTRSLSAGKVTIQYTKSSS